MPYISDPETDQLTLPSNGEYWVKMKHEAEFGDGERAKGSMIKISRAETNGHKPTPEDIITETEVSAYNSVLISRMVVEWNLTDQTNHVMAITPANVERLKPEDGDFLAEEASKRLAQRSAEDQRNFQKQSGRRSTATK